MSPVNRVLSVLLALALLVVGVLVVVDVVAAEFDHGGARAPIPYQRPSRWLHGHTWTATPVVIGLAVLALLGLILLIGQLKPRRPGLLALHSEVDHVTVGAPRASLSRAMSRVARTVDGVSDADAELRPRTAHVSATTSLRDTAGLAEQVRATVTAWLDGLQLERTPAVRVSIDQRER